MTTAEPLQLSDVLSRLYESEINVGLKSFWDSGWDVWIGDDMNGLKAETQVHSLTAVAEWLDDEVRRLYPASVYAVGKEECARRQATTNSYTAAGWERG